MIQDFYVTNFMSIKERQGISFVANNKIRNEDKDYLVIPVDDNLKLLKIGLMYGYNASGKSNMLYALESLRHLVLSYPENKDSIINDRQFALGGENEPTCFELTYLTDSERYIYSLEISSDKILQEDLKIYPIRGKKSLVFFREYNLEENISKISFGKVCGFKIAEKNALVANTLNNATLFSAYLKTNVHSEIISDALSFFKSGFMDPVVPGTDMVQWSLDRIEKNDLSKEIMLTLLKKANLQISDMKIIRKPVPNDLVEAMKQRGIPDDIIDDVKVQNTRTLLFTHHTDHGDFNIEAGYESRGTIRYFGLSGILGTLVRKTAFICIDEIESALHSELIDYFLQLFLANSRNSQILATTHNINLMDLDYLRHDDYWFCEKNDDGASEYYSLQDFGIHKDLKISNLYKVGKLGAVPDLSTACELSIDD